MFANEKEKTLSTIQVQNLTKIYGHELVFIKKKIGRKVTGAKNVSFQVKRGEIFGFLGPNGAGKTTTIRSILGYLNIQSGEVLINGLDHKKNGLEIRRHFSYVPSDVSLCGNFTG